MSLRKPERARERARLVRDAFHQAAVADEAPRCGGRRSCGPARLNVAASSFSAIAMPTRVGESLAERSGRRLDAGRQADFRMARRLRMQLPEALQLVERQVVAGEVQAARTAASSRGRWTARSDRDPASAGSRGCASGAVSTARRRSPPCPSACRDGRSSRPRPRPSRARESRSRARCRSRRRRCRGGSFASGFASGGEAQSDRIDAVCARRFRPLRDDVRKRDSGLPRNVCLGKRQRPENLKLWRMPRICAIIDIVPRKLP